ncbi:hypothetical protein [Janibacter hoylei]|uniref:hypothetical protein n=1 Tax=Janibacter hoylei TaxID=364298 RepID=UPI0024902D2F|nr:hypothetical protein [Janibacter hoylei]
MDARVVGHRLLLPELPGGADHLRLGLHPGEGIGDEGFIEAVVLAGGPGEVPAPTRSTACPSSAS